MKNIIKDSIFVIIFIILFNFCTNIFILKGNGYGTDVISFYNQKENSLDMIFFGSSHSYATFSPDIIEEETGLKSYNFATQQQPLYITYHYMIEALKKQHPKYFVLEIGMSAVDDDYTSEGVIREALDKMKPSINKIKTINISVPDKSKRISYYLNIIKYHSRYNELSKNDIITGITYKGLTNKGFKSLPSNDKVLINNDSLLNIKELKEISNKNQVYLRKIIDLAKETNVEIIFVKSPCQLSEKSRMNYNWTKEFAKKNDIKFIDYNEKLEDLNLTSSDYYDEGHVSKNGAIKVSRDFAKFIINKYNTKNFNN